MVTLVTDWSLLALRVLQEVAALPHLAEHHGLPLPVVGTEDVVRLGVGGGAVPVIPAVVLVREDAGSQLTAVRHLVRGQTVRPRGGAGAGGAVGGVRAGPATTVHCLGRVTETVQRVELEARGTGLVADTALVTEVVLVARLGVLQLNKVLGPAQPPVRECVVALPGEENISPLGLKIFLQFYLAAEERTARQRRARVLK